MENEELEMQKRQRKETKERLLAAIAQGQDAKELLWEALLAWQTASFKTVSGLPFTYEIRVGKRGRLTKELWVDRREGSKSLGFGGICHAFDVACQEKYVSRPKGMGDIRGVSYMYPIFWSLGIMEVPQKYAEQMKTEYVAE